MIQLTHGNLLDADVDALVNAVNTVGVMGKGIALLFKERFPENYKAYRAACRRNEVTLGKMFITETQKPHGPRLIISFPTKDHWRFPSKIEWVASGLEDLKRVIVERQIRSIAIPALGSGNGKLNWNDVLPLIQITLGDLHDVNVFVYQPTSTSRTT